ncbi:MAG: hypothetical protein U9Q06_04075 [Nanoarchaeota archaeon]|nr:hypothetical protein [Nanoarchaeota archaeon]
MTEQNLNPRELYEGILEEEKRITTLSSEMGSKRVIEEMLRFVQESKEKYQILWEAGLCQEAEWLRTLAYHWAGRYERVTGRKESPGISLLRLTQTQF